MVTALQQSELLRLTVASIDTVAEDVAAISLMDSSGTVLPAWEPGAHIDLHLPSGKIRQYSLCGSPGDLSRYKIAVLKEEDGRGGSKEVHERIVSGQSVSVSKPRNHFPLVQARSYLFIAGGIGITPIMPMIADAQARNADWRLIYGGRVREKMAFCDELEAIGDKVSIVPEDRYGLIDLDRTLAERGADIPIYCCGPEPLIAALKDKCEALGQADIVHYELFGPATDEPVGEEDTEFEVELVQTGITLTVPPGVSLLEVVRKALPDIPSSCETGFCGTCEVRVVHGTPLHRDTIMTDEEKERGETMMICVGRSRTPKLGLDL